MDEIDKIDEIDHKINKIKPFPHDCKKHDWIGKSWTKIACPDCSIGTYNQCFTCNNNFKITKDFFFLDSKGVVKVYNKYMFDMYGKHKNRIELNGKDKDDFSCKHRHNTKSVPVINIIYYSKGLENTIYFCSCSCFDVYQKQKNTCILS